jgi:sugar phosphate isomerase/epimerase
MQIYLYGSIAWRHPLGISRVLEWANEFGWDGIDARGLSIDVEGDLETRLNAFGYDMLGPRQIRASARRELRRRIDSAGLPLLGLYCASPVNLPWERGEACRALFAEYLHLAHDLGATWVRTINNTTHSGAPRPMPYEEAYQRAVNGLRELSGLAQDLNIGILLENNENSITPDAESLLRVRGDLGNACRVGIAYDPVNAYFQGLDVNAGLETLKGRIDVLHVKNVKRWPQTRWDYVPRGDFSYEWKSLADGDIDWPALLGRAAAAGFDGPIVYEYVNPFKGMPLTYWDSLPEPEDAAGAEAEYLRGVLTALGAT